MTFVQDVDHFVWEVNLFGGFPLCVCVCVPDISAYVRQGFIYISLLGLCADITCLFTTYVWIEKWVQHFGQKA